MPVMTIQEQAKHKTVLTPQATNFPSGDLLPIRAEFMLLSQPFFLNYLYYDDDEGTKHLPSDRVYIVNNKK